MEARTKTFDAVAESRKWKQAVAKETEGMTQEQTLAYFDRVAVQHRFDAALRPSRAGAEAVEGTPHRVCSSEPFNGAGQDGHRMRPCYILANILRARYAVDGEERRLLAVAR